MSVAGKATLSKISRLCPSYKGEQVFPEQQLLPQHIPCCQIMDHAGSSIKLLLMPRNCVIFN